MNFLNWKFENGAPRGKVDSFETLLSFNLFERKPFFSPHLCLMQWFFFSPRKVCAGSHRKTHLWAICQNRLFFFNISQWKRNIKKEKLKAGQVFAWACGGGGKKQTKKNKQRQQWQEWVLTRKLWPQRHYKWSFGLVSVFYGCSLQEWRVVKVFPYFSQSHNENKLIRAKLACVGKVLCCGATRTNGNCTGQ